MKKLIYPFLIIEFAFFAINSFLEQNNFNTLWTNLIILGAFIFDLVYLFLQESPTKETKKFGIIFTSLVIVAQIINLFESIDRSIFISLIMCAFLCVLVFVKRDTNQKLALPIVLFSIIIILGLLFGIIYKINNILYYLLIILFSVIVPAIVVAIRNYKGLDESKKANYFFLIVGMIFLSIYIYTFEALKVMDPTAEFFKLLSLVKSAFFIPSVLMTSISFTTFQQL